MKKLRSRKCPCCGYVLDAASNPNDESLKPRKDDITVCINCAEILQFDKNLRLKKLQGMVLDTLPQEQFDEIINIRKAIIKLQEMNKER